MNLYGAAKPSYSPHIAERQRPFAPTGAEASSRPQSSGMSAISSLHHGQWAMPVQSRTTQYRARSDFDFPYHSPAFGCGFRYHYPDALDDSLQLVKLKRPSGLDGLAHLHFMQALENEWGHASIRETAYGVSHRAPPGSRKLRESELQALQARERQEFEDLQRESIMNNIF
mmetsp:Transcript_28704/g.52291  ORF Transcript_28704/g.52291 Transcript_28704/m.52291 type:complete len:171 (+) Transcript_28704:67-579(+)